LFYDLLIAFKQDVIKKRYKDFSELLDYCKHSANPIGRLILELFDVRNEKAYYYSDKICTALQLTNFFQDLKIDYQKGRIYLPQDEMDKFFVSEKMFAGNETNLYLKNLLEFNIERTEKIFIDGRNLLSFLKGRLKREINWTILGGETILGKIKSINYDVLNKRPVLTKSDYFNLFVKSIFY